MENLERQAIKEKFHSKFHDDFVVRLKQKNFRSSVKTIVDRFLASVIQTYGQGTTSQSSNKAVTNKYNQRRKQIQYHSKVDNIFKKMRFDFH